MPPLFTFSEENVSLVSYTYPDLKILYFSDGLTGADLIIFGTNCLLWFSIIISRLVRSFWIRVPFREIRSAPSGVLGGSAFTSAALL